MAYAKAGFWTPWGHGSVTATEGLLVDVHLPPLPTGYVATAPAAEVGSSPLATAGVHDAQGAQDWAAQIEAYFRGERSTWTPDEVDFSPFRLTPFREAVYRALLAVPAGETISYSELAAAAGRPGAARAVGTAMAENPIPVVVPCHRVVRADGSLGRYGEDDRWKGVLLELEGRR